MTQQEWRVYPENHEGYSQKTEREIKPHTHTGAHKHTVYQNVILVRGKTSKITHEAIFASIISTSL